MTPDDDIDPLHGHARRAAGTPATAIVFAGNVDQHAFVFEEEMLMIAGIGVEIAARGIDDDLAQQPAR